MLIKFSLLPKKPSSLRGFRRSGMGWAVVQRSGLALRETTLETIRSILMISSNRLGVEGAGGAGADAVLALDVDDEEGASGFGVAGLGALAGVEGVLCEELVAEVAAGGVDGAWQGHSGAVAGEGVVVDDGGRADTGLVEGGSVENGVAGRVDELVRQVAAVVEGEARPAIGGVEDREAVLLVDGDVVEGVEAAVVPADAIGDVPRSGGIVEAVGVDGAVPPDRGVAFIDVVVAGDDEVDIVLVDERLESRLTLWAGAT
nr:hypothetical protein CFP56_01246 [Quercus suber]